MPNTSSPLTRRRFLRTSGGLLAGLALTPLAGCEFNEVTPKQSGRTFPFLTPVGNPAEGGFFIQNGAEGGVANWSMPDLDPGAWALTIDGLVAQPLTLTLADLAAEPQISVVKTIRCIIDSNEFPGLIGTALFRGVALRPLLERAGIDRDRAQRLRIYGVDGFTNNLRLDDVYRAFGPASFEPLLVTHMNGQPLTREHGRPGRLLINDGYGYKNVKWLGRIEATASDEAFGTYQQVFGYVDDGRIRVASKIADPVFNQTLPAGPVTVSGFAVSGAAGIAEVAIAIDDGPFQATRIVPIGEILAAAPELNGAQQLTDAGPDAYPFPSVWAPWDFRWDAAPGAHTIRVRATDGAGNQQQAVDETFDDGFNPIVEIEVLVEG